MTRDGIHYEKDQAMYHLGDPCIHCGTAHHDVEPGLCSKAVGLGAAVRNIEYLSKHLAEHEKKSATETVRLRGLIAGEKTRVLRAEVGLDLEAIARAETILAVTDYSRGGEERNSARQDAIKWFATGIAGYRGLKHEFFGTKNYDRWSGQRADCEYGCGPRHGSICFSIGLKRDARKRALTDEERESAIYYLVNLERIQAAKVSA